jgi:1-deoxy-D-xylulose-5-phosphate synthase
MRFLKPVDKEILHEIFDKFKKIFVIEDHINMGALGSIIKEFAWENHKDNKITFINLRENFFRPGNFIDALQNTELAPGKIYGKIINS